MANKPNYVKGTTPKGIAKYPRLTEPDTKFNKSGVFSTKLILSAEDAAPLMEVIDKEIEKAYTEKVDKLKADGKAALAKKAKRADPPYLAVCDDEGNETGEVEFSFKMNHQFTKKDGTVEKRTPLLFDAKGHKIQGKTSVWGGSEIKVAYQLVPFDSPVAGTGVSARLNAVQIIKLVSGTGGTASSFGFGEEEGYEASEDEEDAPFSEDQDQEQHSADSEEDDF